MKIQLRNKAFNQEELEEYIEDVNYDALQNSYEDDIVQIATDDPDIPILLHINNGCIEVLQDYNNEAWEYYLEDLLYVFGGSVVNEDGTEDMSLYERTFGSRAFIQGDNIIIRAYNNYNEEPYQIYPVSDFVKSYIKSDSLLIPVFYTDIHLEGLTEGEINQVKNLLIGVSKNVR